MAQIYNFRELRSTLSERGIRWRSSGDTEVLLEGLALYGTGFLSQLNGMLHLLFGIKQTKSCSLRGILSALNPFTLRPQIPQSIFSQVRSRLIRIPWPPAQPNFYAIQQHLHSATQTENHTALKGISRIAPGTWVRWKSASGTVPL